MTNKLLIGSLVALLSLSGCVSQPAMPTMQHATVSPFACKMLHAAGCTYQIRPEDSTPSIHGCMKNDIQQPYVVVGDVRDDGKNLERDAAFIGFMGKDIVIAFRGTETPYNADMETVAADWTNDGNAKPTHDPQLGTVHSGFLSSLNNTWNPILRKLNELKNSGQLANAKIYVTGHSKGGSVAQLAALRLKLNGFNVDGVYTFAAARAGGADFASQYAQLPNWRFENQGDIVPHLPANELELKAFHALPHGEFSKLNGDGVFVSAGLLQYITKDLQVYDVAPGQEAQLDKVRLYWFEKEAVKETIDGKLLPVIAAAHDWTPPPAGDTSGHRYDRAACGGQ